MKNKILIAVFTILSITLIGGLGLYFYNKSNKTPIRTDYTKIDLGTTSKLMIVAHPDDEMLWGGSKLIEDDYLVVCITCGNNKKRVLEFTTVIKRTNDKYIMLNYPDKTNGMKDDWSTCKEDIYEDIENIYNLKDWEEVVTHNPEGEYGHIHHIMTSQIVSDIVSKDKLIYFGKYYSKRAYKALEEKPPFLEANVLNEKKEILKMYESQSVIINYFTQMFPHEEFKTYIEWQELYNEENR